MIPEVAVLRKFLLFVILAGGVAILYSTLSDPERREKFLGTIEDSTGVNLDAEPEAVLEGAGRAAGDAAEKIFKELGDTLTDPAFQKSVEKWGRDALDRLDETQLKNLQKDIEREVDRGGENFDNIFQEYLGKVADS